MSDIENTSPESGQGSGPLLSVQDLTVSFRTAQGPTSVVKNLEFDVPRGGALGIVGESGSGKSMPSLAIMGRLPKGG
ncbi:peptide ABC transporter ATP-binding protein, partial [Microbacterium sp. ISL-103]|uniref:ATP-binding cassette domain-containing protein n=1 Tax=Microbacterium sp. ISL-103 TaxID=2819156 RepID=UPI001C14C47D|nr:peptide ABC transporter ATP-binding protein [Microbacterium sp. ISL-103]